MQKLVTTARQARILADMKPLNEMLAEWRELLRLTPAEASRRCDIGRQQWWELESGRTSDPRASTLKKVSEGTGIPIDRLVEAAHVERLAGAPA